MAKERDKITILPPGVIPDAGALMAARKWVDSKEGRTADLHVNFRRTSLIAWEADGTAQIYDYYLSRGLD